MATAITDRFQDEGKDEHSLLVASFYRAGDSFCAHENDFTFIVLYLHDQHGYGWKRVGAIDVVQSGPEAQHYVEKSLGLLIPEEPNWTTFSQWINECTSHGAQCSVSALDPQPTGFRLIDVDNFCVVRPPPLSEYAALSYVWGNTTFFRATLENINTLERKDSLLSVDLPATIKDAMVACRRLGKNYLWVDALCIVQDDMEMLNAQINQMNLIYSHPSFTIVACEGSDAKYGLPGLSRKRMPELKLPWGNIELIEQPQTLYNSLTWSIWNSRAWTYQEAIFSKRLLFFRNTSAAFECTSSKALNEAGKAGDGTGHVFGRQRDLGFDFFRAVNGYSSRDISNDEDVLHAFSGIINYLYGDQHIYGMPLREFDAAVLWVDFQCIHVHRTTQGEDMFPTWSWASLHGSKYIIDDIDIGASLASWAFVQTDLAGNHVVVPIRSFPEQSERSWSFRENDDVQNLASLGAAIAWREGSFKRDPPSLLLDRKIPWSQFKSFVLSRWPTYEQFWQESRGENAYVEEFSAEDIQLASFPNRILVYTQSATLWLVPSREDDIEPTKVYIRNAKGKKMGRAILQENNYKALFPSMGSDEEIQMEFIALSTSIIAYEWTPDPSSWHADKGLPDPKDEEADAMYFRNDQGELLINREGAPELIMMNVMMVEQRNGVYRRLALGIVSFKLWIESCPVLKSFVLE
ncbi:uncharacterized protein K452DRAFT_239292 [Aplosporella prunicola CBS 121167]|uniref:Heterokaryon incompatibility domain-containing protein n=1 Tax=Aplosporella prunicola CBS 121167 TaxID=1176127 RepID=A0A6A6AU55_9PEZI|nr:uncharacterized protein K452DRAFT_239292 [Aplosporella prunicola CBS 121167]KAF2135479.1 hypothetical protein K452DRAFT_239292 [Aplosporella prunicola CBS 121167]